MTMMLTPVCQSAHMSKITNYGLTWSGTGCFIAVPYNNSGRQRVKWAVDEIQWCTSTGFHIGLQTVPVCRDGGSSGRHR